MSKKHGQARRGELDIARCPECERWFTPTGLTLHCVRIHGKRLPPRRKIVARPRSRYLSRGDSL